MNKKIVLGLGGSGSKIAELYSEKLNKENDIVFLGLDSDVEAISNIKNIPTICMTDYSSLGQVVAKLEPETVSEWFPCSERDGKVSFFKSLDMGRGANGWRMKGLLSFEYMLSDEEKLNEFKHLLDAIYTDESFTDKTSPIEVYLLTSLCGGTGSALLFAVSLYIKKYVESKYNGKVIFKAILTCPDIYVDLLTQENKIKAYANTYATLRELNAVDLISKGYNLTAKESGKAQINYKIGSENSRMGVLFDSFMPEFNTLNAKVFDKVYFVDRTPSITSLETYEEMVSKVLSVVIDENIDASDEKIYAGVSIAEIVFSPETIVDYVAKKKTYEDLQNEWLLLYNKAKVQLLDEENTNRLSSKNDTIKFAKELVTAYNETANADRYFQYLALNRVEDSEEDLEYKTNDVEISLDNLNNYSLSIKRSIYEQFDNGCRAIISEEFEDVKNKVPAFKLFDSKQVKEEKMQKFADKVDRCVTALVDFHNSCIDNYKNIQRKITEDILSSNGEFSLKNNVLSINGKFIHPATAMLSLSLLCKIIDKDYPTKYKAKDNFFKAFDSSFVPENFGTLSFADIEEYEGTSPERFSKLISLDNPNLIKKLIANDTDVSTDLIGIYENIINNFVKTILSSVKDSIFEVTDKYYNFFGGIKGILDEYKIDVKIALMSGTESSITQMNVGSCEEIKEKAYSEYLSSNDKEDEMDAISGEIVYNQIINGKKDEDIFIALTKQRLNHVANNNVIKRASASSVLRVLHDKDIFNVNLSSKTQYNDLSQALSMVALPLNINHKNEEEFNNIRFVYQTLMSIKSAEFAKEMIGNESLDLQDALSQYLFSQGCPDASVKVTDKILGNKIFAVKKVYNFSPWLFNKIDEYGTTDSYYPNYVKALNVKQEQFTQMWNPHLVKETARKSFLPFINPKKQEEYEVAIYKAVLYMLSSGLFVVDVNNANVDAFYYRNGDELKEVYFEGNHVTLTKEFNLIGFSRENPEIAIKYSNMFDDNVAKELANLPLNIYEKVAVDDIVKQTMKSDIVKLLLNDMYASVASVNAIPSKNLIDYVYEMYSDTAYKTEAENFAKTIGNILNSFVKFRTNNNQETYNLLISKLEKELKEGYENQAKKSGQKKYKDKSKLVFDLIFTSAK